MTPVPRWALVSALAAPALLIGGWTIAAGLQHGGFDPVMGTISDLAAVDADHRWFMTAMLVGVGVSHVGTAVALRPLPLAGRAALATGGVATALVAVHPLPGQGGTSVAHGASAGVAFVALSVWPALSWRRGPLVPPVARPAAAFTAASALTLCLGLFVFEMSRSGQAVGLTERIAAGAQSLWPLVVVIGFLRPITSVRSSVANSLRRRS